MLWVLIEVSCKKTDCGYSLKCLARKHVVVTHWKRLDKTLPMSTTTSGVLVFFRKIFLFLEFLQNILWVLIDAFLQNILWVLIGMFCKKTCCGYSLMRFCKTYCGYLLVCFARKHVVGTH